MGLTGHDLVREYFPGTSDETASGILWNCTCYPFMGGDDAAIAKYREQLADISQKSAGNPDAAMGIADAEVRAEMARQLQGFDLTRRGARTGRMMGMASELTKALDVIASSPVPPMLRSPQHRLTLVVRGLPQPTGSKSAAPYKKATGGLGVAVRDSNPKSKDWKLLVASEAQRMYSLDPLIGPLLVELRFYRSRPQGHWKKSGGLSKDGSLSTHPTTKPDVLKLARAVEDALTNIVWKDDAQIVREHISKHWGDCPRMEIDVYEIVE